MNLYVKASCDAMTDGKLIEAGPDGFTLYFKGLMYSKVHLTDGFVPQSALGLIGVGIKNAKRAASQLVALGLWKEAPGGYTVGQDKWAKHQTTKDEVDANREAARARKQAQRDREKAKAEARVTQQSQRDQLPEMSQSHANVTEGVTEGVTAHTETETETEIPPPPRHSVTNDQAAKGWQEFCEAYPQFFGPSRRSACLKRFKELLRTGVQAKSIIAGATRYRGYVDSGAIQEPRFIKGMFGFLDPEERAWDEAWEIPPPRKSNGKHESRRSEPGRNPEPSAEDIALAVEGRH